MSDVAGFGPSLEWLPRSVRVAMQAEAVAEQREARRAAAEKAERIEQRRSADLAWAGRQAAERGEEITTLMTATGQIPGRSIDQVFADAAAASAREDARAEFEARKAKGERLEFVGELAPEPAGKPPITPVRRSIERKSERFMASVAASREAERKRDELEDIMPQLRSPSWRSGRRLARRRP